MKVTININQFREAFMKMDRLDNFSYEGLNSLFNFLGEMDEQTGIETELDVIALCCEFSEYTVEEALNMYSFESLEELEDNTLVIYVEGNENIIIQEF